MTLFPISQSTLVRGAVGAACATAAWIGLTPSALAAEQIELIYQNTTLTISTDEIQDFAETGAVPEDLQLFFDETAQVPEDIRTLITRVIRIPSFVESFLDSPTGEFVLLQLDQTINSSSSAEELTELQAAFSVAASDRDLSVLELLEVYPESNVRLNLTNLEETYERVNNFVVNVQPAIETAIGFLQDIVCECETDTATSVDPDAESMTPTVTTPVATQAQNCQIGEVAAGSETTNAITEGLLEVRPVSQAAAESQ